MLKKDTQFSSVQSLSHVQLFATPWTAACQASLSITNSNSHLLSQWFHPTISSSVIPFSSCLQSFPALESFLIIRLFASGGQSIGASASASVHPLNIQDWFSLGLNDLSLGLETEDKGPSNQSYGFSSGHVWMWELDYKENWVLKNWCFWTVVLEKTLQS